MATSSNRRRKAKNGGMARLPHPDELEAIKQADTVASRTTQYHFGSDGRFHVRSSFLPVSGVKKTRSVEDDIIIASQEATDYGANDWNELPGDPYEGPSMSQKKRRAVRNLCLIGRSFISYVVYFKGASPNGLARGS